MKNLAAELVAAKSANVQHDGPGGFSPGPLDAIVGPQRNGKGN